MNEQRLIHRMIRYCRAMQRSMEGVNNHPGFLNGYFAACRDMERMLEQLKVERPTRQR